MTGIRRHALTQEDADGSAHGRALLRQSAGVGRDPTHLAATGKDPIHLGHGLPRPDLVPEIVRRRDTGGQDPARPGQIALAKRFLRRP